MRISLFPSRGHELCHCGERFTEANGYYCHVHGTFPRKVYLDCSIVGGDRFAIRRDVDGDPLSLDKGRRLLERMEADAHYARSEQEAKRIVLRKYAPRDVKRHGFEAVRDAYLEDCERRVEKEELSISALRVTRCVLLRHFGFIEGRDVEDITSGVVGEFYDTLKGSKSQRQSCVNTLLRVMTWARRRELTQQKPERPRMQVNERSSKAWLQQNQQAEILAHIPPEHKPVFEFIARFGWRPAEARALKVRDVDFGEGIITQRGSFDTTVYKPYVKRREKTGAAYPLEPVREIIHRALAGRVYGLDDFVFTYKGKHYTSSTLMRLFRLAAGPAGYPRLTINEFGRHSVASQIINAGGTPQDAADQLNNTSGVIRSTYGKVSAEKRGKVIKLITPAVASGRKTEMSDNGTNGKN